MRKTRYIQLLLTLLLFSCQKEEIGVYDDLNFHPLFTVNVIFPPEGLGDRSFVDEVYEGVEVAVQEISFEVDYIIPETIESGGLWLANCIQSADDPSLIIVGGNQYTDAVNALKGNFNGHKILLLEGIGEEYNGLASVFYHTWASSYIAGYLSAQLKEHCRAASICGFNAPFLTQYVDGFEAGVTDAGGTAGSRFYIADDFSGFEMPDSAYTLTAQLTDDFELFYGLATGSNFGIINALRDCAVQKYAIGINSDQSWMGYHVVTGSVVNQFGGVILDYIRQFQNLQFQSGSYYLSLEGGYTEFVVNPLLLSQGPDEALISRAIQKEKEYFAGQKAAMYKPKKQ